MMSPSECDVLPTLSAVLGPQRQQRVERAFNGLKHWRGLATRYDKHAVVYRGGIVLAAALIWLADLSGVVAGVLGVVHALWGAPPSARAARRRTP